ncbi:MAG: Lrp/AsnC family transcriptional regulator [Verrucomicrobiia bacterium]
MEPILEILTDNARTPTETIAQMLGQPVETVAARIRQLEEDKTILGYKALIDADKADAERVRAVIEVKITPERDGGFNRIANRIARYDEVHSCHLMSGSYDLLVVVDGKDLKDVAQFVSAKLSTIQGVLSTATHFMLKAYKEQGTVIGVEESSERLKVSP